MKKELLKKQRGITLVALIITIIVLIILAAVSVNALLKIQFIDLAMQGTVNYTESQSEEANKFEELNDQLNEVIEKINGKGKINDNIKLKVDKIISEDGLKVIMRVEIEYSGIIENIYINDKKIEVPEANAEVYIFEEVVEENGRYVILAKDADANYNVIIVKVNELLGDMEIWDKSDIELLKKRVEEGKIFTSTKIKVMADIDLGGENDKWSPIGTEEKPFLGELDGNNHKINTTGEVVGERRTGGIVGANNSGAKISNCSNNANINKDKTSFTNGLNCGRNLRQQYRRN